MKEVQVTQSYLQYSKILSHAYPIKKLTIFSFQHQLLQEPLSVIILFKSFIIVILKAWAIV